MKWNESELLFHLASRTPDWEGQLSYKAPKSSATFSMQQQQYKERYLKLYGNILVLSKGHRDEQTNVFILESFTSQVEDSSIFSFSLNFHHQECTEKHLFVAVNLRSMNQWLDAFTKASLEKLKETLLHLQCRIKSRTGTDPLVGTYIEIQSSNKRPADADHQSVEQGLIFEEAPSTNTDSLNITKCKSCDQGPSSFTSHLGIQMWEETREKSCQNCNKSVAGKKSSFKSHIEEPLIKF